MKLPNTDRGFPAGDPTKDWTAEQMLAYLLNQYNHLTAPDGSGTCRERRSVIQRTEPLSEKA